MYRVVIVDDEEPVLDSFSFMLEKEKDNFSLCGKARSGTEAIRLIREAKPDLVFMDIQMPDIDGIDAITQVRLHHPEIVFILATAYERFDIAQKAIPLGVFSYMVKPVSRKAFTTELYRVKSHLDRIRQGDSLQIEDIRFLQKTREEVKNRFLSSLAWENPSTEEWEAFSRLFSLRSDRGTVCLAEIQDEVPDERKGMLYTRLCDLVRYKFNCFHTMITGRLMLFFPEDQGLDALDGYLEQITAGFLPVRFILGRGGIYDCAHLASSFAEAFQPFRHNRDERKTFFAEKDSMRGICAAFLKSDFQTALPMFEDFWMKIFQDDSFEVAKGKMVAFFTLLFNSIDNQVLSAGYIDINPAGHIMLLPDVEAWRQWSADTLDKLQKLLKKYGTRPLPPHLVKALALIREQYSRPIQLSSLAEECQITASYLCRLFNEHLGTSFIEYLNRYRVEQATILLRDRGLPVKETSNLVGYQDPNYFSRIFRRYTGLSPSELVNRRLRNEM